jgi:hypothetical protein
LSLTSLATAVVPAVKVFRPVTFPARAALLAMARSIVFVKFNRDFFTANSL